MSAASDEAYPECQDPELKRLISCVQRIGSEARRATKLIKQRGALSEFAYGELTGWLEHAAYSMGFLAAYVEEYAPALSAAPAFDEDE